MALKTKSKKSKLINVPMTEEQILYILSQLDPEILEDLDLYINADEIIKRGKEAEKELKEGKTLSLEELKKELKIKG